MNPEDKNKATLLILATIAVLGVCFFMVRSSLSNNAPKQPDVVATRVPEPAPVASAKVDETKSAGAPASDAAKGPVNPTGSDSGNQKGADAAPPSSAGSNPFKKVLSDSSSSSAPQNSQTKSEQAINAMRKKKLDDIQGLNQPPMANLPPASGGSIAPLTPSGTGDLNRIQGTIKTPTGAAVMLTYNGETLFLKEGDRFGDGFRVKKISSGSAVFTRGKKSHKLTIGESLAALY